MKGEKKGWFLKEGMCRISVSVIKESFTAKREKFEEGGKEFPRE